MAISPDGKWILAALVRLPRAPLILLPAGAGEPKQLPEDSINHHPGLGAFSLDGRRIIFSGNEPDHPRRTWVAELGGGRPRPVTPEGVTGTVLSPDGRCVVAQNPEQKVACYPVDGGAPRILEGFEPSDRILRWAADGKGLFVNHVSGTLLKSQIYRVDVSSGHRIPWRENTPRDAIGIERIGPMPAISADGKTFVYTYQHELSDLYVVEGLK